MESVKKYSDCKTDSERLLFIKKQIEDDDKWLLRGLVAIFKRQTESEKAERVTKNVNGVGFSAFDAEFLTGMAQKALDPSQNRFSQGQIGAIRRSMRKYSKQLLRITQGQA